LIEDRSAEDICRETADEENLKMEAGSWREKSGTIHLRKCETVLNDHNFQKLLDLMQFGQKKGWGTTPTLKRADSAAL